MPAERCWEGGGGNVATGASQAGGARALQVTGGVVQGGGEGRGMSSHYGGTQTEGRVREQASGHLVAAAMQELHTADGPLTPDGVVQGGAHGGARGKPGVEGAGLVAERVRVVRLAGVRAKVVQ